LYRNLPAAKYADAADCKAAAGQLTIDGDFGRNSLRIQADRGINTCLSAEDDVEKE